MTPRKYIFYIILKKLENCNKKISLPSNRQGDKFCFINLIT